MKGMSHAVVGFTTGVLLAEMLGADPKAIVSITTIASLIPDIDEENSMINQILIPIKTKHRNPLKVALGLGMLAVGYMFLHSILLEYLGAIIVLSTISSKVEYRFSLFDGLQKREYHRTLFHHPLIGGVIFIAPINVLEIPSDYKIAFMVGIVVCHYFMDTFTTYGLPFYPFKRVLRMPIHFDSRNSFAEFLVVTSYVAIMLIARYPQLIGMQIKC
jgi:membrane-bound metal-dependent hydrolase YbcI (DUF457 family)